MHSGYTTEDTALLEAARALGPQIEACADQIEQDRCLPQPLIAAIVKAGLFKLLVPREMGGSEASPATLVRVIEAVSRIDASVGWCVCFGAVNGISSGCLPAHVAKDIFAQDDHACIAASAAPAPPAEDRPPHRATVVDGGYQVSGRWAFASGCMHATWLIGSAPIYAGESPRMGPNGQPETRLMFFPRQACQIIDTWDVTGMRGTGSHDFAVVDVFVPHERTLPRSHTIQPHHPGALYIFGASETPLGADRTVANAPWVGVAGVAMAAVCLGIARGAIDAFIDFTATQAQRGGRKLWRDNLLIQDQVGRAEAALRAARSYVYQTIEEIWHEVQCTRTSRPEQILLLRLAGTQAATMTAQAVDIIRSVAGTSSVYQTSPLARRFKDIHVATQNIALRWEYYAYAGRSFLGVT